MENFLKQKKIAVQKPPPAFPRQVEKRVNNTSLLHPDFKFRFKTKLFQGTCNTEISNLHTDVLRNTGTFYNPRNYVFVS